jgi:hypothetical protein
MAKFRTKCTAALYPGDFEKVRFLQRIRPYHGFTAQILKKGLQT